MPQTERRGISRRQLLTGAGTAVVTGGLVLLGYELKDGDQGSSGGNRTAESGGGVVGQRPSVVLDAPTAIQVPPTPTPLDYDTMALKNFDQIDRADEGKELTINNFVIHGFERITAGLPGTNIAATEDAALSARIASDGKRTVLNGFVLGAGCLLEIAEEEGLLEGVEPFVQSEGNSKIQIWTLKRPLVIPEIRATADKDIPGNEGGKVLDLKGYKSVKSDIENLCDRRTNLIGYNAIKEFYLLSERVREEIRQSQVTPGATSTTSVE